MSVRSAVPVSDLGRRQNWTGAVRRPRGAFLRPRSNAKPLGADSAEFTEGMRGSLTARRERRAPNLGVRSHGEGPSCCWLTVDLKTPFIASWVEGDRGNVEGMCPVDWRAGGDAWRTSGLELDRCIEGKTVDVMCGLAVACEQVENRAVSDVCHVPGHLYEDDDREPRGWA
jgi:hypothetical protein